MRREGYNILPFVTKIIEWIDIDLNGVYQEMAIFHTEIATLHYDNAAAKKLFDGLKKSCEGSLSKL